MSQVFFVCARVLCCASIPVSFPGRLPVTDLGCPRDASGEEGEGADKSDERDEPLRSAICRNLAGCVLLPTGRLIGHKTADPRKRGCTASPSGRFSDGFQSTCSACLDAVGVFRACF